ncbi:uncharacterized protein BXIN_1809 [Babesia sp. Xinjiang]|uniref:uncharacterized protein n=1 Tax=Babesia sp. Xinjiang TaxID=462227 RepID=UPI000A22F6D1|nr:uncharacterized protein BXIN_1610 [Babesia sp. Xinjiang]XP_028871478.1 uncharacterized protein BXIN_1809 [Babesia sp. Xinjiang]ORM40939.1 hypothetical protein BXIN_1610 [Babesia sp. Xinjiang]ORM41022.1 hypothetical protein BXIN_1809 [Babesia sp. Xinjiang]
MTFRSRVTKATFSAVVLVTALDSIESLMVDVSQPELPPCVDVFEGSFADGGAYRMIHSSDDRITAVSYGRQILNAHGAHIGPIYDVYIQDYRRGNSRIIATSTFTGDNGEFLNTYHCNVIGDQCAHTNRHVKNIFQKSAVYLRLDITKQKCHPFIAYAETNDQYTQYEWYLIKRPRGGEVTHPAGRLVVRFDRFHISPILNIDTVFHDKNLPPSSLSSHCAKLLLVPESNDITIWFQHGVSYSKCLLRIPPIEDGIFKPKNIVIWPRIIYDGPNPLFLHHSTYINIDISKIETYNEGIIVLANLKRGDWLYTQYSLVPIEGQIYKWVRVTNSKESLELYRVVRDDECITHVEVFDYITHGWQYVVVNIDKADATGTVNFQMLYLRQSGENGVKYFHLGYEWLQPCINMLYNINVVPSSESDQEYTDVMIDAMHCPSNLITL